MDGVVSLLDDHHDTLVRALWEVLDHDFGVNYLIQHIPIPHFSYHVAEKYDHAQVEELIDEIARTQPIIKVRSTGLALFTGPAPVLYVPVVRTAELTRLHALLWEPVSRLASGTLDYYHPQRWLPHVTLAQGDLDDISLMRIVERWSTRPFEWEITVNNLALICDVEDNDLSECRIRLDFGGGH
jgi:2'-5' RNA ligase